MGRPHGTALPVLHCTARCPARATHLETSMFHLHLPRTVPDALVERLMAHARASTFQPATVNTYGKVERVATVRNNERLEWDNPVLARELESHLMAHAGQAFPYTLGNEPGVRYARAGSHFRMYRYTPGQYFKPHRDGHFRDGQEESFVTVLVYLDDADGGETVIMPTSRAYPDDWVTVVPRRGDVLLFQHDLWHEGRPVHRGEKHVLRTDLFYRTGPA